MNILNTTKTDLLRGAVHSTLGGYVVKRILFRDRETTYSRKNLVSMTHRFPNYSSYNYIQYNERKCMMREILLIVIRYS
jgi:hypothetical protein